MPDIALIGEGTFLFKKLFHGLGVTYQFLQPETLGSPFLPQYRMLMIPTGFANPQYSKALPALQRSRSNIAEFVKKGAFSPSSAASSRAQLRMAAAEAEIHLRLWIALCRALTA